MAADATRRHPEKRLTTRVIYRLLSCTVRTRLVQSSYYVQVPERCRHRGRSAHQLAGARANAGADADAGRHGDKPARPEEAESQKGRQEEGGKEEGREEARPVGRFRPV